MGFCKQVSFDLFPEGRIRCCAVDIIKEFIPDLRCINIKTMAKMFG